MAQRLLSAGHEVTVWNRTRAATGALVAKGALVAESPTEAAQGQEAIVSMLFDDAANEEVLLGASGAIAAMKPGALHIASSTISVALSGLLAQEHESRGQLYVAAPVFGRPNVAAEGKLWIVAAGAETAVAKARPILEAISRGVSILGEQPVKAHAAKLAGNFLITMMIQSLSEAVVFARANAIDPAVMLETVNSALFQSPFYAAYSKVMLDPPEQPGATIALGVKDLNLFLDASEASGVRLVIAGQMAGRFSAAIVAGLGKSDWAAGLLTAAELAAHE
jgi:3-hydroxyisobutyrate dehydrogenase-like beta-hydroxyacid dehydrogenase